MILDIHLVWKVWLELVHPSNVWVVSHQTWSAVLDEHVQSFSQPKLCVKNRAGWFGKDMT